MGFFMYFVAFVGVVVAVFGVFRKRIVSATLNKGNVIPGYKAPVAGKYHAGKRVLIVGGTKGLGLSIAKLL